MGSWKNKINTKDRATKESTDRTSSYSSPAKIINCKENQEGIPGDKRTRPSMAERKKQPDNESKGIER